MSGDASITSRFIARYAATPRLFWAPGRVNLIGDHIDYCGGMVLPMPIQFGTTVAVHLNDDERVRGSSLNFPEVIDVGRANVHTLPVGSWGRFLCGTLAVLADLGIDIAGVDVLVASDIPGSGLSSSASLCVGLLHALTSVAGRPLPPLQMALAAQRVEHEHIGVQCGLMDQAVIVLAEPGSALLFDCYEYGYRSIALDDASIQVVVVDTGRTRQLVHSAYNTRLHETRSAADVLGVSAAALARFDPQVFKSREHEIIDSVVRSRARHVVSEAARVTQAAAALESHQWALLGGVLTRSHESLRSDYAVSCPELDVLVMSLTAQTGCYGARMTGAGFGGSVVALFDADAVEVAMAHAAVTYSGRFGITPRWFVARSLGGVRSLDG
jgi:galactokinase